MIIFERIRRMPAIVGILVFFVGIPTVQAEPDPVAADTVKAGRYDNGKMWAFEYPPLEYLEETYNFTPDAEWFDRARLSVLRIPGCSASFISPTGLVVTNHHCVRSRVSEVSRPGENLLDNGFYASSLSEERPIPGYYADQLIAIEDVTDEVDAARNQESATDAAGTPSGDVLARITERIQTAYASVPGLQVQIIPLYNGGRHSAYIFRRYSDVRLVFAVELQLGFFGGEGDNFTYPRYALDFSFLRIYGEDGNPLSSPNHFDFSDAGVEEGDLVFVIGNPGSTSRQATVSQLEFFRDVQVAHTLANLNRRLTEFRAFYQEDPQTGELLDLRNVIFSISNSQKAYAGRAAALQDPAILARRANAEKTFKQAIDNDPELATRYGALLDDIANVQADKRKFAGDYGAFRFIETPLFSSGVIRRAIAAVRYLVALETDGASVEARRSALLSIQDRPQELEKRLLEARLDEFSVYFGADSALMAAIKGDLSSAELAADVLSNSVLASASETSSALEEGTLSDADPGVALARNFMSRYEQYLAGYSEAQQREQALQSDVGRARFAVYGVSVPSDATFSPRFTDGVVQGYAYNGTLAPPYTTLFGLMDHYYSYGGHPDWTLPERWRHPPKDLNLGTPLNFVSTSDTIGGNSGSPAVTPDLEIVGLNFDRNIEGLSRDYIYLPDRGRNIMVDMRAVKESLDKVYDADRIVLELTTGRMAESEEEADAILN